MQTVYEAATSIDARLALGVLNQAGIHGHIDGEYLQGGVGEIQAFGLVKLRVAEVDRAAARALIEEWQQAIVMPDESSLQTVDVPPEPVGSKSKAALAGFFITMIVGVMILVFLQ